MQVFDFRLPSGQIQGNFFECGINDIGLKSVTIMFVSMLGFWWTARLVDHLSSTLLFLVPHAKGLMMMVMMTLSGCSLLTSGGSNSHHQVSSHSSDNS